MLQVILPDYFNWLSISEFLKKQFYTVAKEKKISGVILAGGANSRFGGMTKSTMSLGGVSIISRMIDTLKEVFEEIIIVTNTPDEFSDFKKYKIVQDEYKKVGPLGGIHAAMNASSNPSVFVFAGDMPFISKELIISQITYFKKLHCDVLIPRMESYDEPLHAIYNLTTFIKLDYYLLTMQNYKIKDFLGEVDVEYLNIEGTPDYKREFTNINTPSDLSVADTILQQNFLRNN
jgi:molybdopterin-guanine dinucleotide biosynthesis protein A